MTTTALVIDSLHCSLPDANTNFFYIEPRMFHNIYTEEVGYRTERVFVLKHPQTYQLLDRLGEQNTLNLHRIILSYFDAASMLLHFQNLYLQKIKENHISFNDIETQSKNYNITIFNNNSLDANNSLCKYDEENEKIIRRYSNSEVNEVQEYFWSMNLKKLLENYNVNFFEPITFNEEERNTSNINLLIYKMLNSREISMVMYTWRKLNAYKAADFISNVNNILEFIKKDIDDNNNMYKTGVEYNQLNDLIRMVHQNNPYKRKYYYQLFNDAESFGFFSRHGKNKLLDYVRLSNNNEMVMEKIVDNIGEKLIPNEDELKHSLLQYTLPFI